MKSISSYYDLIASITKNQEVVAQELAIVNKYVSPGSKILDIGCGTGRHLIPLLKGGYVIHGLDINKIHLDLLTSKLKKEVTLFNSNFNDTDFNNFKYDALLLFWNTLNEICLDEGQLSNFFDKAKRLLNRAGIIIINLDDISIIDPSKLNFSYEGEFEGSKFKYLFSVNNFNAKDNITHSEEHLTLIDEQPMRHYTNMLVQKWWDYYYLIEVAKSNGFRWQVEHIAPNNEIYLILSKE